MLNIKVIEGHLDAKGLKFVLIASRFNEFIVQRLLDGAMDYLVRHGANTENILVVRVPGAFDMPVVVKKILEKNMCDGIICLGAVIRGATPHFEYIASEVTKGLAKLSLDTGTPIGFGILTTDTLEQAIERAGSKMGNKGAEAAQAVLESIRVIKELENL